MNYPDDFNSTAFDIAFGTSDIDTSVSDGLSNMLNAIVVSSKDGGLSDAQYIACLLYTSPSPRDRQKSRMPSSA